MSIYDKYILPTVIHTTCGSKPILKQREKIVPLAEGRVLEVGMGSGINIPFYDPNKVEMVWGLEPSEGMRRKASKNLSKALFDIQLIDLPSEEIPLDTNSADTIVLTYTLCTITNWQQALHEMRRVLKPQGTLLFCEHGEAPDENIRKWQQRINPVWKKIAGGCNLNRPIPDLLNESGFKIDKIETQYLPNTPKFAGFNYWGISKIA